MARIPNADRAILDLRKIEDYCLSPAHPRGKHKARVFQNALGLAQGDAHWLRQVLLSELGKSDAFELASDHLGRRWRVDVQLARQNRNVVVRTIWIVRNGEQTPRFVTCWVI